MKKIFFILVVFFFSLANLLAQDSFEDCFEIKRLRVKAGGANVYEAIEIAKIICNRAYPSQKKIALGKVNAVGTNSNKVESQDANTTKNNNDSNEEEIQNIDDINSNIDWGDYYSLRVNWEFKGDVALVNQPQSSNTNSANYRDRFVANISGSSSNLNLIFTGKNSSFGLNYFADGRHSYTASASRKTGGWNLNGSLIIDQDSVAEDANVSDRSSVQATHKSGLRLNTASITNISIFCYRILIYY